VSCADDAAGPRSPGTATFAVVPNFGALQGGVVEIARGRFVLTRIPGGEVAQNTVIDIPAGADSLDLTIGVPLLVINETLNPVATRTVVDVIDFSGTGFNEPRYAVGAGWGVGLRVYEYESRLQDQHDHAGHDRHHAAAWRFPNMAAHPLGTKIYVAQQNPSIAVVDVATDEVTSITFTGAFSTYGVGVTRDGTVGFVTDESGGSIFAFDPTSDSEIANSRFPITGLLTPRAFVAH
jgi:hypothetical protein